MSTDLPEIKDVMGGKLTRIIDFNFCLFSVSLHHLKDKMQSIYLGGRLQIFELQLIWGIFWIIVSSDVILEGCINGIFHVPFSSKAIY